jgi:hypothetical protein
LSVADIHPTKIATQGLVGALGAFLSRICLPAAEEYGLLLQDRVRTWRGENAAKTLLRAKNQLESLPDGNRVGAHPRLAHAIIDESSWTDNDEMQALWAGLLVSACTEGGRDESNKIFVDILAKLTGPQVRVLQYACAHAEKRRTASGLIMARELAVGLDLLREVAGTDEVHQLDRDLDHMRGLNLLEQMGGFNPDDSTMTANLTPTALALNLYVRCQGVRLAAVDFFDALPASP